MGKRQGVELMKIKWLGQSGYVLSDGRTVIYIDPYLSDSVSRIENRPRMRRIPVKPQDVKADGIICTHNHLDHLDIDAIPLIDKSIPVYAPSDCREALSELGVTNYAEFDEGAVYKIGDFKITAVFADHTVPAVGVLAEYGAERLYFTGDTYYNKRLEEIRCDYLFVCINGRLGNMNVTDAVKLDKIIKPRLAVPNHYDMFESNSEDPLKFTDNVSNGFIMEFDREYEVADGCLI